MLTLIAVIVGSVLWTVTWAIGLKGFDGFLLFLLIVLGATTLQMMLPYLPGRRSKPPTPGN
jgi:hypothetical protein